MLKQQISERLLSLPASGLPSLPADSRGGSGWARGILILNDFHIPSSLAEDSGETSTALSDPAHPTSDKVMEDLIEELIEAF